jgi:hypothetical protein
VRKIVGFVVAEWMQTERHHDLHTTAAFIRSSKRLSSQSGRDWGAPKTAQPTTAGL